MGRTSGGSGRICPMNQTPLDLRASYFEHLLVASLVFGGLPLLLVLRLLAAPYNPIEQHLG